VREPSRDSTTFVSLREPSRDSETFVSAREPSRDSTTFVSGCDLLEDALLADLESLRRLPRADIGLWYLSATFFNLQNQNIKNKLCQ
jgi:hypothetical protein